MDWRAARGIRYAPAYHYVLIEQLSEEGASIRSAPVWSPPTPGGGVFIGVSGLIGAGKSTLTRQLADHLDQQSEDGTWKAVFEPVETNPYLEDFYKDIPRWTFNMQMFLLAARFKQHQQVLWDPCHERGGGVVQDRTIYEDTIFARMHRDDGLLDDRDWNTYIEHFHVMQGFLRYPDVILYLRVSPEKALERINQRSRDAEAGIPLDYLKKLYDGYEEFVEEMARYTVVVSIDWSDYWPVERVAKVIHQEVHDNQKFLRSLRRI